MVRMFLLSALSPKAAVLLQPASPRESHWAWHGEFPAAGEGKSAGKRGRWQGKKKDLQNYVSRKYSGLVLQQREKRICNLCGAESGFISFLWTEPGELH